MKLSDQIFWVLMNGRVERGLQSSGSEVTSVVVVVREAPGVGVADGTGFTDSVKGRLVFTVFISDPYLTLLDYTDVS